MSLTSSRLIDPLQSARMTMSTPDFTPGEFARVLDNFAARDRRFGAVKV